MDAQVLDGGFPDAPVQAAAAFRAVMRALARPGTLERISGARPPAPLSAAAGGVVLTLCDPETPLHLAGAADCGTVRDWITFHTGAPLVGRDAAMFALGSWRALLPLSDYRHGTPDYPDRSASLIVEMEHLSARGARLRGPGIRDVSALSLPETEAFQDNARRFPLGLDFIFCCGDRVAALPRTTHVEAG